MGPLWLTHSGYGRDAAPARKDAEGWQLVPCSWCGYRTLVETFAGWIPAIVEDACFCAHEKYLENIWTQFRQALVEDGYFRKNIHNYEMSQKEKEKNLSLDQGFNSLEF